MERRHTCHGGAQGEGEEAGTLEPILEQGSLPRRWRAPDQSGGTQLNSTSRGASYADMLLLVSTRSWPR